MTDRSGLVALLEHKPMWRCFHCDDVFTDRVEALDHFGSDESKTPACRLSVDDVKQLRALEAENAELRRENDRLDNDARLWHESEADRVRRIGHCQWWQEKDSLDGEILALKERLAVLASLVTPSGEGPATKEETRVAPLVGLNGLRRSLE